MPCKRIKIALIVEMLEGREHFDVQLSSTGTLIVSGTSGNDSILVERESDSSLNITINGVTQSQSTMDVRRLRLDGGSGNDTLQNSTNFRSTIAGGDGNDSLIGGSKPDTLDGEDGQDVADYSLASGGIAFTGLSESGGPLIQVGDITYFFTDTYEGRIDSVLDSDQLLPRPHFI